MINSKTLYILVNAVWGMSLGAALCLPAVFWISRQAEKLNIRIERLDKNLEGITDSLTQDELVRLKSMFSEAGGKAMNVSISIPPYQPRLDVDGGTMLIFEGDSGLTRFKAKRLGEMLNRVMGATPKKIKIKSVKPSDVNEPYKPIPSNWSLKKWEYFVKNYHGYENILYIRKSGLGIDKLDVIYYDILGCTYTISLVDESELADFAFFKVFSMSHLISYTPVKPEKGPVHLTFYKSKSASVSSLDPLSERMMEYYNIYNDQKLVIATVGPSTY